MSKLEMQNSKLLALREILNRHDPIGLIMGDLNLDEYDPEIENILPILDGEVNQESLSKHIYDVFVMYFDKDIAGSRDKYYKIARDILDHAEFKK